MKYIIFEQTHSAHGLYMPVLFPDHVTHSQVRIEGCKAVSAGFWNEKKRQAYGRSDSLNFKANVERDTKILQLSMANLGTSSFMKSSFSPIDDFIERYENKHGKDE